MKSYMWILEALWQSLIIMFVFQIAWYYQPILLRLWKSHCFTSFFLQRFCFWITDLSFSHQSLPVIGHHLHHHKSTARKISPAIMFLWDHDFSSWYKNLLCQLSSCEIIKNNPPRSILNNTSFLCYKKYFAEMMFL